MVNLQQRRPARAALAADDGGVTTGRQAPGSGPAALTPEGLAQADAAMTWEYSGAASREEDTAPHNAKL